MYLAMKLVLITAIYITHNCRAMIMRNNALISEMVSHFQDNKQDEREEENQPVEKVLSKMQNVLCRNFPSIPCAVIVEDETLRGLIQKSIQQIKYKKMAMEKTTPPPGYHLTLFPMVNSEDLSNFLQIRDSGHFRTKKNEHSRSRKQKKSITESWSQEKQAKPTKKSNKDSKKSKRAPVYSGRKKIRKFYPHKIKYKDKTAKNTRNFGDYSEEKLSMSVEVPDMTLTKRHQHMSYKVEPADPPVWRIDYMKHGDPSINMMRFDTDPLKGKLMKTGPNVIVDDSVLEQGPRKDVMHSDVYIKNNYIRKNNNVEINNSDAMD